ncbi:MAG: hypothetical protein ACFCA4_12535 [Cyanophyceae cyanobacterium]
MIAIRIIKVLRKEHPTSIVRAIIELICDKGLSQVYQGQQIAVLENQAFWVSSNWSNFGEAFRQTLRSVGKHPQKAGTYRFFIAPPLRDTMLTIWDEARHSPLINYTSFVAKTQRAFKE